MSWILDTNVCIVILKGAEPGILERLRARDPSDYVLSTIVRAELLFGAEKSARAPENLALLDRFFARFESLPFDDEAARHYGRIRAALEGAARTIGANDLLIAAQALAGDHVLVTRNRREFSRVPGLRWESW